VGPFASPQIHDFNPGDLNEPGQPNYFINGGVFWTMPVPKKSVKVKPGRGDALFTFSDLAMFDYFTSVNAILRDGSAPIIGATASVEIHWTGTGERLQVDNDAAEFERGQHHSCVHGPRAERHLPSMKAGRWEICEGASRDDRRPASAITAAG
jgi:hypothetical protein